MTAVEILGPGLAWLWRTTWQASVLVVLVMLAQWLFRSKLTPHWRYTLWWLVLIRLMLPLAPGSTFSIFNVVKVAVEGTQSAPQSRALIPGESLRENRLARASHLQPSPVAMAESASATTNMIVDRTVPEARLGVSQSSASAVPQSSALLVLWGLAGIWVTGIALVVSRLIWGNLSFARRLRRRAPIADPALLGLLEECRRMVGVFQPRALIETPEVDSPALFGCFRVNLLLPLKMAETFSPAELRHVFLHELSHVRRWDVPVNWLMTLAQIVHWFNPVIWLAFSRMRADRELACDALALSLIKEEENQPYGQTIIKFLEGFVRPAAVPGLVGILEEKTQMKRRINMIAKFKRTSRWSVLAVSLLVGLGLITLTDAQNKTEAERSSGGGSSTESKSAEKVATPGTNSTEATSASADADIIDPKTGLKFVVAKTIAGANDVIEDQNRITMSPNGKFLLWNGRVVPLDGSPAFTLKELQGAGVDSWSASWSPDGQKIAFNSEGIEVLPVSPDTGRPTGAVRKLLEEKGGWHSGKIYWSTDSERILFVKRNLRMEHEIGAITLRDARLNRQPDYADFGLVSPDGKTIAYSVPEDGIWTRPVNGGTPRIARAFYGRSLFDDAEVWTSDSQWVASAVDGWLRNEIHYVRLVDGQGFDLSLPEAVGTFVGKSADGKKLRFYRSSFDLRTTSKVIPISGGPAFSVGPNYFWPEHYCWPPDSTSLAVLEMEKGGSQHLWSIPLIGGDRVQFNMESLGKDERYLCSLSPDSQKLLYIMWSGTDQGNNLYVISISLKEGRATGPATLAFKGWRPPNDAIGGKVGAWSPDGTKIAMPHQSDEGIGHLILFADGSRSMQLTQTANEVEQYPQWSPDSKMIAFYLMASDRQMLQVIPAEGGTARTIMTTPKGQSAPFGWSPDSKEVAVVCDGTISGFPIAGGSARVIVKLQDAGYESASWLGWSPDGQRLAFYGGKRGEASRLCLFAPNTGIVKKLENSPDAAQDFLWSPDSKMICCTAKEAEKVRPAGIIRELDVAEAVQKAPPVAERKPTEATAGPQAEPIAGPVFTDNFDNGPSKHWRFQDSPDEGWGPGRHAVENGELMLSHARACLDGIDWTDYIVTVRVCMKESAASGEAVFGVNARTTPSKFGSTSRDRYSLLVLYINNASRYLLLDLNYVDASGTLRHGRLSQSPCSLVRDKWYTLEFEIRGQQLRGYLDGKLVIEATDARLSKGGPLWLNTYRARVLFDDFSVRQLP